MAADPTSGLAKLLGRAKGEEEERERERAGRVFCSSSESPAVTAPPSLLRLKIVNEEEY